MAGRETHREEDLQGRSVTLDIYSSDDSGKKFNAEIQRSDKGAGAIKNDWSRKSGTIRVISGLRHSGSVYSGCNICGITFKKNIRDKNNKSAGGK